MVARGGPAWCCHRVVGVTGLTGLRFDDLRLSRCVHVEVTLQDAYPVGEFRPPSHPARWHAAGLDAVWQADTRSPDGPHVSTATCSNSGLLPAPDPVLRQGSQAPTTGTARPPEAGSGRPRAASGTRARIWVLTCGASSIGISPMADV